MGKPRSRPALVAQWHTARRACACALTACGVSGSVRDDGAGASRHGKLLAHAERLLELLDELEEVSTALSNDEMTAVVEVMCKSLLKATSRGNVSISLAAQQQVCKIPEYVMAVTATRRSSGGGGGSAKPSGGVKAKVA